MNSDTEENPLKKEMTQILTFENKITNLIKKNSQAITE